MSKNNKEALLYLLPAAVLFLVFYYWPLLILLGPSGCGKTTTLRMIAGFEEITKGELYMDGRVVNDIAPGERNIAMVFQRYALFQHLSVWDNITFGLQLQRLPQERLQELGGRSKVLFGLRPEACTPSFESAMINGKVDFVENTGNLKTATLKLATGESFYLQDSDQGLQMEDIRGFNFDWQNVCLFDAESGENLAKVR